MTATVRCPQVPCPASQRRKGQGCASQGRKLVERQGGQEGCPGETDRRREEGVGCAGQEGAWAPVPEMKVQWAFICLVEQDRGHPPYPRLLQAEPRPRPQARQACESRLQGSALGL